MFSFQTKLGFQVSLIIIIIEKNAYHNCNHICYLTISSSFCSALRVIFQETIHPRLNKFIYIFIHTRLNQFIYIIVHPRLNKLIYTFNHPRLNQLIYIFKNSRLNQLIYIFCFAIKRPIDYTE